MSLVFEWDPRKAAANVRKHGIEFSEAIGVFDGPLARVFLDCWHSEDEPREIIIGHLQDCRLCLVPDWRPRKSNETISAMQDDLLPEYDFDYSQAQPNRFAGRAAVGVTLRPDVLTYLKARAIAKGLPLGEMVNDMLKKDIELIETVK